MCTKRCVLVSILFFAVLWGGMQVYIHFNAGWLLPMATIPHSAWTYSQAKHALEIFAINYPTLFFLGVLIVSVITGIENAKPKEKKDE